jgi:Icc-related predicted phosphoesterase
MFTGRSAEFTTEPTQAPTENESLGDADIKKISKIFNDLNTIYPRLANKDHLLARELDKSLDLLEKMLKERADKIEFAVFFEQLKIQIETFRCCFTVHESELSSQCKDIISRLSIF